MEQRTIAVEGGEIAISEYQTSATGGFVWEAAFVLLRYIERNGVPVAALPRSTSEELDANESISSATTGTLIVKPHSIVPLRILDFSGGTGMLGIAAAHLFPKAMVTVSEFGLPALELIQHNAQQSGISPSRCRTVEYGWGVTKTHEFLARTSDTAAADSTGSGHLQDGKDQPIADTASSDKQISAPSARCGFDVILCSDCLFITVRDGYEKEFVTSLVELCSDNTIVLTAHKMRLWEQEGLVVELLERFFDVHRIKVGPDLMLDFFGGESSDSMLGMFEEAPEIYFCEMRLRAGNAAQRLKHIDEMWDEICSPQSEQSSTADASSPNNDK